MEAAEQISRQFEDVDRILRIVEVSKKEFDQVKKKEIGLLSILALSVLLTSAFLLYSFSYSDTEVDKFTAPIALLNLLSNIILFRHNFVLHRSKQKQYDQSIRVAVETIREIIPIISHSEKWSALQKFELRLRLSKLDISPEGILDDRHM